MLTMDSTTPEVWSLLMNLCKLLEPLKSIETSFNVNGQDKTEIATANTCRDLDTGAEAVSDAAVTTGSDVPDDDSD